MRNPRSGSFRALLLAGFLLTFVPACAMPLHTETDLNWIENRKQYWQELEAQKSRVNQLGQIPQEQKLGPGGTVVIWKWSLNGAPEKEYFEMRYTWRNTTGRKHDFVRVWLELRDAEGKLVGRNESILSHPLGKPWHPGDTFTGYLQTPMRGAHRTERGWYWKVGAKPLSIDVLGDGRW